ncbi:MAG: M14 family metallopeptidase [Symbiobacteriaceae bacterium]|nr:M14 family metallopeptidase [Symbiobacteriaceae bacterium]
MSKITSPLEFFGHIMGEDRKVVRWDKIVEYFYKLDSESDCIQVTDMGPSTEGHPFLLVTITAAENLAKLEEIRQISKKIGDPRGLTEEAIDKLVAEGKVVVVQSMSLHASEIGGTQMSPELAYELIACDCPANKQILKEVIFLMVPCFNPDGQHMVTDWYNRWLGTEYEGGGLPYLYHKYAGHDNNRDGFAFNLVESQYMAKILFQDWHPQAFQDHHHMGSNGARLFVAPYGNPTHPNVDPLIWTELQLYGSYMVMHLDEQGKKGIVNNANYGGWGHFGFHWNTNHHNIAGMLTESASARVGSPLYIPPEQLTGSGDRGFPEYGQQTNFVNPWEGGWWRLRDIVEQQKIAAWAILDCAARNRDTLLRNSIFKAQRQVAMGKSEAPYAFIISSRQHDPLTVRKFIQSMLLQGFEVQYAEEEFKVGNHTYPKGSYVLSSAQPKRPAIFTQLKRTFFPDTYWFTRVNGEPLIYDGTTDTYVEYMGVRAIPAQEPISCDAKLKVITQLPERKGTIGDCHEPQGGYIWTANANDSFRLANQLMSAGLTVWRSKVAVPCGSCGDFPVGSFVVMDVGAKLAILGKAEPLGIHVAPLFKELPECDRTQLLPVKLGVYHRYYGGNMEEGWTRLVLEQFDFPYTSVLNPEIKAGNLREKYDVLLFPADRTALMVDVNRGGDGRMVSRMGAMPPEYSGGMGDEGVKAVKEFVEAGGTLVTFGSSCDFAIETLGLGLRNVLAGLPSKEFLTRGAILNLNLCPDQELAWGMPKQIWAMHADCPAFVISDNRTAEKYNIVARYPERDILQSGRLDGAEKIAGKAAIITVPHGKGEAVLIGINVQRRAQMHGTFKLLFNSLYHTK